MSRPYKVFGGLIHNDGQQVRCIVATKTKKRAMELLGLKPSYFNDYWYESGNKIELEVALKSPEKVFISKNHYSTVKSDYIELTKTKTGVCEKNETFEI